MMLCHNCYIIMGWTLFWIGLLSVLLLFKVVVSRGAAAPPAKRQKTLDKYVKNLYSAKSVSVISCLRNVW